VLAACGGAPTDGTPRLYAAASLARALDGLAAAGAPDHTPVLGGTPLLVQQLRAGADPGVLIAADVRWAEVLEQEGLVAPGGRVDLLGNRLAVIAPEGTAWAISDLGGLAERGVGRVAVAETESVPAGRYARAALERAGVWETLRPRLLEAPDARALVTLVARGEADAGIVYASDAAAPGVRCVLDVPAERHPDIVYSLVLIRDAPDAARALWSWLQSDPAARVFESAGLTPRR
jgi:molybdate transport system substrate-binding protein